jgi:hypothetical protein
MNVALVMEFGASRKDPLAAVLQRIHAAFAESGLDEPVIRFTFADAPIDGFTSSVDRVLKRHPHLKRFVSTASPMPGAPAVKMISNGNTSPAAGEPLAFFTLIGIATGVPRSFPFHSVALHFQSPAFGVGQASHPLFGMPTGIVVTDSWWVSGRARSVRAVTSVSVDPASTALPSPPPEVAAVLAACGKAQKTVQIPLADSTTPTVSQPAAAPPDVARAVSAILLDYRGRIGEVVDRALLPHDLPPALEAMAAPNARVVSGPKKPVLQRAFTPLGYDCRGESGTFTLRRRSAGNLTVELFLDVGTWSRSVTAFFSVTGLGFVVRMPLPVAKRAIGAGQYSIGDAMQWQKIVENLVALVAELDRTLVPDIEAAAGPTPAWYAPVS